MTREADRIHLHPKDLRRPDEFQTAIARLVTWANQHRTVLLACGAVVLVAGAGIGAFQWQAGRRADAAGIAFRGAHRAYEASRWEEAATAFASVTSSYPRTSFGRLAALYRAHALARTPDAAAAATAYGEYLANPIASEGLRQQALLGIGRSRERGGETAAAIEAYSDAAAIDGPLRIEAVLAAARLHVATGDAGRARELYRRILSDLPEGETRTFVLAQLPTGDAGPGESMSTQSRDVRSSPK